MTPQLLPDTVCQELIRLFNLSFQHCLDTPLSLAQIEEQLQKSYQAAHRVMVAEIARQKDEQCEPEACPCGGQWQSEGKRARELVTPQGEVRFARRSYVCTQCQAHTRPLDRAFGLEPGVLSPKARQGAVGLCTSLPFEETHRWFTELLGVSVSKMTLWRATQKAGGALLREETATLEACGQREGAVVHLKAMQEVGACGRWALSADGVLVRVAGAWTEVRVGVVGPLTQEGTLQPGQQSYTASLRDASGFRQQLAHHALARKVTRRTDLVILSDGAPWTKAIGQRYYPQAVMIRDWWHAVEYLWQAAQALYGEGTPKTRTFVEELQGVLRAGNVEELLDRLESAAQQKPIRGEKRRTEFQAAVRYLDRQKAYLRYDEYREAGWPIGSGPVEAACKTVVGARMKRSGMRWSLPGANHMLRLRAAYYSSTGPPSSPHN